METGQEIQTVMRDQVLAWEQSGLGQMEYCRQKGLVFSQFNYWVRKLRPKPEPSGGFVAIKVKREHPDHRGKPALELVLPGGARVNFYHPVDPAFIKSILF